MPGQKPAQADGEVGGHHAPFTVGGGTMSPIVLLHAGGDVGIGGGGQPQVVGGVRDRRVPQIRLKDRQQRVDVLAVAKPGPQVVASHRVAQVMDAGSVTAAAVGDPGLPQKPPEVVVDVHQRQRLARPAAREEPLFGRRIVRRPAVAGEPVTQRL